MFLLLLRSPAISLGFTFLGEIFAYVTVFNPTIDRGSHIPSLLIFMSDLCVVDDWHISFLSSMYPVNKHCWKTKAGQLEFMQQQGLRQYPYFHVLIVSTSL